MGAITTGSAPSAVKTPTPCPTCKARHPTLCRKGPSEHRHGYSGVGPCCDDPYHRRGNTYGRARRLAK